MDTISALAFFILLILVEEFAGKTGRRFLGPSAIPIDWNGKSLLGTCFRV
jgi:hypothetical protein